MKLRKTLALLMVFAMMSAAFAGCSKTGNDNSAGNSTTEGNATTEGTDTASNGEVVTLKWIMVGNEMPKNYDAWLAKINPYLAEKIGVNIDVEVVPWGDWDTRRSVIVNSGESFDILFTDGNKYNSEVALGSYLDISDLVKTAAPDLYSYIPADYWDAVSVNGKIYSVPTYKDSSSTQYFVWDKAIVDKYSVDYENINSLAGLTDVFKTIKEGEGTAPVITDKNGFEVITSVYDQMGVGLPALGVKYDDQSRKVVNVLEQEDILSQLDTLHQWYEDGIINADAPAVGEVPNYRPFFVAQGWSGAAITTWGPNMGVEAVTSKFIDTIVSNNTVRGSLNGISSSAKNPEKALQFLQLLNLDSKVRDAFYYGLEGDNFNYTDNGEVERLNNEWSMAGYTQGTFFTVSKLASDEINQWDEVKELNANANPSVLLGFNLDTTKIETELANCRSVYEKYRSELMTGAKEPRELVKTMSAELDAAGFQTVVTEAQSQIDATYNK
ncbi:MAG: ABC transporter substrate-binding protein [Anaerocolumna sp.]